MRLLITGGCGFIGSNFINYYFPILSNTYGADFALLNIDAMYYCASETNVTEYIRNDSRYRLEKSNLIRYDDLFAYLNTYSITHVIHFAAQSHVQRSFEDSLQFTMDNVLGTHTLLEACRKFGGIEKFIHVSTDEVYGESMNSVDENHKTEHSILCPTNPYAATKAGAELIAQSYCHSYGMPIIITRGNNVYGFNQYPEKLIPLFIQQLSNGLPVTIQGQGTAVRAFLHCDDTVRAFALILENGLAGEIYNIGTDAGMEYSVMDIAKMLIQLICKTDDYDSWITFIDDRPFNDQRYYISNEKIKQLGWTVTTSLEEGLRALVQSCCQVSLEETACLSAL